MDKSKQNEKCSKIVNDKPVILLDIDWVVNPLCYVDHLFPVARHVPYSNWSTTPEIIAFLGILKNKADIVFISTWEKESLDFAQAININITDYLEHFDFSHVVDNRWHKADAINAFIEEHTYARKIVILDDDFNSLEIKDSLFSLKSEWENFDNVYIPDIDKKIGIIADNMETIFDFLKW